MPNQTELFDLLLKNRGITPEARSRFLSPSYEEHVYDPYLLHDMERAVVRIFEAIEAKEKIVIYSDYDCDGIPSAVIMHDFFKKVGYENFSVYIPDRHDEGYGLHADAIESFIRDEVGLLITFDLGITAIKEVTHAQANGIDVIITDHHLPHRTSDENSSDILPPAYAIINPKKEVCSYPDDMLCGAGLAFKLVQALIQKYGEYWNIPLGWEKWLLDMAGLATLADQVPLVNENRVLASYGLKVLRKTRRPGLIELFRKAGVPLRTLTEEDITFTLAPRLNAASRMAHPMDAFLVLSTTDPVQARASADHLAKINDERKQNVAHIMKEVKKEMAKREEKSLIVIGNPAWRVGVLGLVSSKLSEEYKKPSFVWGQEGSDIIRGSCRGWGNVNLVSLMSLLPEKSLLAFGGHAGAGGFSVSHEEVHFLEERLLAVFSQTTISEESNEDRLIDATISIDDVTGENYMVIEKLAPYGMGNPKPSFLFKDLPITDIKEFGKEQNHLEIIFTNSRGSRIKAIAFFKTRESFGRLLTKGERIDLIATFEKSTFAGRTELRLRIVDILNNS